MFGCESTIVFDSGTCCVLGLSGQAGTPAGVHPLKSILCSPECHWDSWSKSLQIQRTWGCILVSLSLTTWILKSNSFPWCSSKMKMVRLASPNPSPSLWKLWTFRVNKFAEASCITFLCMLCNKLLQTCRLKRTTIYYPWFLWPRGPGVTSPGPLCSFSQGCSEGVGWAAFSSESCGPLPSSYRILTDFHSLWL